MRCEGRHGEALPTPSPSRALGEGVIRSRAEVCRSRSRLQTLRRSRGSAAAHGPRNGSGRRSRRTERAQAPGDRTRRRLAHDQPRVHPRSTPDGSFRRNAAIGRRDRRPRLGRRDRSDPASGPDQTRCFSAWPVALRSREALPLAKWASLSISAGIGAANRSCSSSRSRTRARIRSSRPA